MSKYFAAVSLGALAVALSVASCKCNKEEEIPPMPSAPAVNSTPPPPVELAVELDASDDGDADAGKKATGPYNPSGLMACCNALAQNAKSAPPTQAPFSATTSLPVSVARTPLITPPATTSASN